MNFLTDLINNRASISIITKIELLGFPNASSEEYNLLSEFCNFSKILQLDDLVVEQIIYLRRKHKTKLQDSIIAATALAYKLTLLTHNVGDFKNIPDLLVRDSHKLYPSF